MGWEENKDSQKSEEGVQISIFPVLKIWYSCFAIRYWGRGWSWAILKCLGYKGYRLFQTLMLYPWATILAFTVTAEDVCDKNKRTWKTLSINSRGGRRRDEWKTVMIVNMICAGGACLLPIIKGCLPWPNLSIHGEGFIPASVLMLTKLRSTLNTGHREAVQHVNWKFGFRVDVLKHKQAKVQSLRTCWVCWRCNLEKETSHRKRCKTLKGKTIQTIAGKLTDWHFADF